MGAEVPLPMTDPAAATAPPGPPHDTRTETHSEPDRPNADAHDEHGHAGEALGPVDLPAWGAGVLGVAVALVVAVCFAWSTGAL